MAIRESSAGMVLNLMPAWRPSRCAEKHFFLEKEAKTFVR
jgi:hypothetical protein